MSEPRVVKEMPSVEVDRAEFERRFRARFRDPLFEDVDDELGRVIDAAWRIWRAAPMESLCTVMSKAPPKRNTRSATGSSGWG